MVHGARESPLQQQGVRHDDWHSTDAHADSKRGLDGTKKNNRGAGRGENEKR